MITPHCLFIAPLIISHAIPHHRKQCRRQRSTPTCTHKSRTQTRRQFIISSFTTTATTLLVSTARSNADEINRHRTVFDEERERNEEMVKSIKEEKLKAINAGFESVEKSKSQLDDILTFLKDEDWQGIRKFVRLFNDAVQREGMYKLSKQLDGDNGKALELCSQVTDQLRLVDKLARQKETQKIIDGVVVLKQLLDDFQQFRPALSPSEQ